MSRWLTRMAWYAALALCVVVYIQHRRALHLTAERDRYSQNSQALLFEVARLRVDSTSTAVDVHTLRLSVGEYERHRAADMARIKALGIKIRNLEAAATHRIQIAGPLDATVRDTLVVRDTAFVAAQRVQMITPHIQMRGIIENQRLKGDIHLSVTLRQAVWIEYKRRWLFWKRVKAVHQTISSDNPFVEVNYSEYIKIEH